VRLERFCQLDEFGFPSDEGGVSWTEIPSRRIHRLQWWELGAQASGIYLEDVDRSGDIT
jgi:hypothetical protein